MIAKLKNTETPDVDGHPANASSAERAMIADQANIPSSTAPADVSSRRLRNLLILANVVAWIAILGLIKVFFF
jgi:hypothetical protein